MSSVALGSEGLTVSKVGFGCMGVTAKFGSNIGDNQAIALFRVCYNLGCTHFDTAEISQAGNPFGRRLHESVVGKFVSTVPRQSVTVATKFNPQLWEGKCDIKTVTESLDGSLNRLGVQHVDVYYLYKMPETVEVFLEWVNSVKTLVGLGKVKYVGLCNAPAAWIRAAHEVHPISCVQHDWSVVERAVETDGTIEVCQDLKIGIVAFSPLARDLFKHMDAKAVDYARNQKILSNLNAIAARKRCSAVQLCLAWVYNQAAKLGVSMIAIPGTSKIPHAQSNIASLRLSLSDADMEAIYHEVTAVERVE